MRREFDARGLPREQMLIARNPAYVLVGWPHWQRSPKPDYRQKPGDPRRSSAYIGDIKITDDGVLLVKDGFNAPLGYIKRVGIVSDQVPDHQLRAVRERNGLPQSIGGRLRSVGGSCGGHQTPLHGRFHAVQRSRVLLHDVQLLASYAGEDDGRANERHGGRYEQCCAESIDYFEKTYILLIVSTFILLPCIYWTVELVDSKPTLSKLLFWGGILQWGLSMFLFVTNAFPWRWGL